jgi:hypothetical protein
MRKIAIASAAVLFATLNIAAAQTTQPTQPVPQKESPKVEKMEMDKSKGNTENQNQNDIKAKEQAPKKTN